MQLANKQVCKNDTNDNKINLKLDSYLKTQKSTAELAMKLL
jgi:hypothetical protein